MATLPPNQKPQIPEKQLSLILKDLHRGKETALKLSEMIKINGPGGKEFIDEISTIFCTVISDLSSPTVQSCLEQLESSEISNGKRKLNDNQRKINNRKRARSTAATRVIMSKTIEDGQAWRKYGQKPIQNSNNPRSYYRCTHKDQGCEALKQIQKSEEDPNIFILTYMGNHTCKNNPFFFQPSSPLNTTNSCLISFGSSSTSHFGNKMNQNQDGLMSRSFQSSKREGGEEAEVLSKSTVAVDPTVARISEQTGPVQIGLNCSNENLNNEELFVDPTFDGLEALTNLSDFGFNCGDELKDLGFDCFDDKYL